MLVDYHTHTALCKHASGSVDDYVRSALERGLDEIGCSEHIPMPDGFDERHRMTAEEFRRVYLPQVAEAMTTYADQIRVRRGVEADFLPGAEWWIREFLAADEFDYVLGSVHFLGDWGVDDVLFVHKYAENDVNEVYKRYFEMVRRAAESGLFDIIAHFDLVKKFGYRPTIDVSNAVLQALTAIKDNGLCIEINTSGLRKPVNEIYPSREILMMIKKMEIPLTLGSDAHDPRDVGASFDLAVEMIREFGRGMISLFQRRQRTEVPISFVRKSSRGSHLKEVPL
jgi:histidinol-phosphatase (PHP family)